jgi:guanine deaminase
VLEQIVRGPLLIPRDDGVVDFFADGVLVGGEGGTILYAGSWSGLKCQLGDDVPPVRKSDGVMLPPLLDIHTHVPQHPIRGHFSDGVGDDEPGGKLLNSLKRNVFPAEARCDDAECARNVAREFLRDTLSHGVVGGAAYMTPSAAGTEAALEVLPDLWQVGLVMMNQNCPPDLRTNEQTFEGDVERLAKRFAWRLVVTDRFAVAVNSPLRRRGAALAQRFSLRTQTHLNEQLGEKRFVERELYPGADSYTDVYQRDGLFDPVKPCIVAHCIHMRAAEWAVLRDSGSVIAHCPTSNLLLGSGLMDLNEVVERRIPYALATDVGASPTVSMLAEMARFLRVHEGKSPYATPSEALYRATRAPAGYWSTNDVGQLETGRPMSFIEAECARIQAADDRADNVIRSLLPVNVDNPPKTVMRVTLGGRTVYDRGQAHA